MLKTSVASTILNYGDLSVIADITEKTPEELMKDIKDLVNPTPDAAFIESLTAYVGKKLSESAGAAIAGVAVFATAARVSGLVNAKEVGDTFKELADQMEAYGGRGGMYIKAQIGVAELDWINGEWKVVDFTFDFSILEFKYSKNY